MGKEAKNELMGKVYREFSRQKYNKYKAQFPKLRESEIVSKIIKEWDSLDSAAKESLQKIYEKKNYLTSEDISSSEALVKADLASKEARIAAEKSAKKTVKPSFSATRYHSNVRASSRDGSDFNRGSEQKDDSRLGESSSPQVIVGKKTHPISKAVSKSDYISFFKYHYTKLSKEHKRWSTQQITKVVRLLWKKKKGDTKTLRRKDGKLRTSKPLSGRRYFRKIRHLTGSDATNYWKQFPLETRNHWTNEAQGIEINNTTVHRVHRFSPSFTSNVNNLQALLSL
jgi:hypothetical protein